MWHDKKHVNNKKSNIIINASEEDNNKLSSLSILFEIIIVFLGVISISFVFISIFNISISKALIFIISIILSVSIEIIFEKVSNKHLLVALIFIFSLVMLFFRRNIFRGAKAIINKILYTFKDNSGEEIFNYQFDNTYSQIDIDIFFIVALIILACVISFSVRQSYNIILASIIAIVTGITIAYFCVFPSNISLILLMAFLVALVAIEIDYEEVKGKKLILNFLEYSTKMKVGIYLIAFIILIFATILLIYPDDKYKRLETLDDIRYKLENIYEDTYISDLINESTKEASGGIGGGNLGTVDTLSYKNKVDLKVTLPETYLGENGISTYLKGFVGGDYTGDSWEEISDYLYNTKLNDKSEVYQNMNYNIINNIFTIGDNSYFGITKAKIKIENIDANSDYIYAPYNSKYNLDNEYDFIKDLYVSASNSYIYSFDYYINNQDIVSKSIDSRYDEYVKFVHETYTRLPSKGLKKIKEKYKDYYRNNSYTIDECIDKVKKDICKETKYDLSPGRLPKDKDFVEYFLYDNKKGYCSHYASAATVILRAMGIPARYVEGYLINNYEYTYYINPSLDLIERLNSNGIKEKEKTMYSELEVMDSNAHAWVEVFYDNLGWVPVEVTSGYSADDYIDDSNSIKKAKVKEDILKTKGSLRGINIKYIVVLVLISSTLFLFIRRGLSVRKKKYKNSTEEVINMYLRILKIFNFLGNNENLYASYLIYANFIEEKYRFIYTNEFINITQIIMKAKYDKRSIGKRDVDKMKRFLEYISQTIYAMLPIKSKIIFKYFKNLI